MEFNGPIFIGDTIRVRSEILAKELVGAAVADRFPWQRQIKLEGKVVQEGVTATLVQDVQNSAMDEG